MGHRRYRNPPIEEALCEFHFDLGKEWDPEIPDMLRAELGDEYSGRPKRQNLVQVELAVREGRPFELQHSERMERVQLITNDGTRVVGVGRDALSVHMLRPYQGTSASKDSGWGELRSRIQQALDAYWKIAKPRGVRRVGVRYINRIDIPENQVNFGDYLKCALPLVPELTGNVQEYFGRTELSHDDGVRLILSQAKISGPIEHTNLILDIDVIWETDNAIEKDMAMEKMRDLSDRERAAFEAVITDHARALFDTD